MTADDYQAIANLIHAYADRIDRGDLDGMAALFAEADLYVAAEPEPIRRDPARVAATFRQYTRIYPDTGTPKTRHVTTNLIIEPDGEGRARTQCYFVVFQAAGALSLQPVIAGRYNDRFEKVAGAWRFRERRIDADLHGDLSAHLLQSI